jgi:3-oxoacyl-[acyl-carrier protein] reductase
MSLAGKVALVTGGSKGIGRATALRLARDGANVVVGYHSNPEAADEVVKQIGTDRAIAIQADVGDVSEITSLVDQTVQRFGKIDLLVPCAGIMTLTTLEETTEDAYDRMFALNVKGPYFLCQVSRTRQLVLLSTTNQKQKAVPHMAPGSHIVLFSTTLCAASTVTPVYLPYVTTKGAVEQMTRVMSKDVARKGISVNCVAPGPTATDLFLRNQSEQTLNFLKNANPNGRIGDTEDIADSVAFLCSSDSRWVTGQTLRVNGGMA